MRPRWLALLIGLALVVIAFVAAGQVADTREGLIAEVVTLLGGLAGVGCLLYGFLGGMPRQPAGAPVGKAPATRVTRRSVNDLVLGSAGVLLALVLVVGLAVSGGWLWAGLGAVLLVPMVAGSVFLCVRFARSPERDWSLRLPRARKET